MFEDDLAGVHGSSGLGMQSESVEDGFEVASEEFAKESHFVVCMSRRLSDRRHEVKTKGRDAAVPGPGTTHSASRTRNITEWPLLLGRLPIPNPKFVHCALLQPGINVLVVQLLPAPSLAPVSINKIQDAPVNATKSSMSP